MSDIKVGDTVEFLEDYSKVIKAGHKVVVSAVGKKFYGFRYEGSTDICYKYRVKKVEPEMKFGTWKKYNAGGMYPLAGNTIINLKRFDTSNGNVYDTVGPVESFFWGYNTDVVIVAFQEQVKEPVVKTKTFYGGKSVYTVSQTMNDTHKITFNTIDGKIDTASIKMEKL